MVQHELLSIRVTNAVEKAEFSFWEKIAESFPAAKTGDFPPDATMEFTHACEKAVCTWLEWNLPKEAPPVMELKRLSIEAAMKSEDVTQYGNDFLGAKKRGDWEIPVVAVWQLKENGGLITEYADGTFWTMASNSDCMGTFSECIKYLENNL